MKKILTLTKKYKLEIQSMNQLSLDDTFNYACSSGNLKVVKYVLTSTELKKHADIHTNNDYPLIISCHNGYLEIVKYLLTSPDLKEHANIHAQNESPLINACHNGHLEIVKYLLTSPDLKEHADIHNNNSHAFTYACSNNDMKMIEYLIFEYCIEQINYIKDFLRESNEKDIIDMFEKRELERKLQLDLEQHNIKEIKIKL